jgi:hypothetical protein
MIMVIENELLEDYGEDDIFKYEEPIEEKPVEENLETEIFENNSTEPGYITTLLNEMGITDPNNIVILDEEGNETVTKFSDLTDEEKVQILLGSEPETQEETESIDAYLKENNLTLEQFLELYKQEILDGLQAEDNYTIDNYSDEELFMIDLKNKYDLTDDELKAELEKEQQNPDLFKKKIDKLRGEYKASEDAFKQQQQDAYEQENQKQYEEFSKQVTDAANKTVDIYGIIDIEDEDKTSVLNSLLELDEQGNTEFGRMLSDPAKLYEAAWFLKYGKDAFGALQSYYTSEISKLKNQMNGKVIIKEKSNNFNDLI